MENRSASKRFAHVYPPANLCIYCGARGREISLSREHIIPIGLGGGLILPKASCEKCRRVTSGFETTCLRKMFLPYRQLAGLVRHEKDLPAHIPLIFDPTAREGGRLVPVGEHPRMLVLPQFLEPPGMLIGAAPDTQLKIGYQIIGDRDVDDAMRRVLADKRPISLHFNHVAFMRMLAKVAHAFAVAEIGLGDLDPELPDLIHGRNLGLASYLIGRSDIHLPVPANNLGHQVAWGGIPYGTRVLVGVRIRLFAAHPTAPAYTVIAGVLATGAATRYGLS